MDPLIRLSHVIKDTSTVEVLEIQFRCQKSQQSIGFSVSPSVGRGYRSTVVQSIVCVRGEWIPDEFNLDLFPLKSVRIRL